ncbi:MAG: hypothetical protein INQ03_21150 [Candidatus Heimdallarchaeota archaeon]|nr:hypothetical protein [Candidatus Heimdallarchaeota archaeon]
MRICFPTKDTNPTLNSKPEPVFGNAVSFVLVGDDPNDIIILENNPNDKEECHMGKDFVNHGVKSIVSNSLCRDCMNNLEQLGIDVWRCDESINILEIYQKYTLGGTFIRKTPDIVDCKHQHKGELMAQQ